MHVLIQTVTSRHISSALSSQTHLRERPPAPPAACAVTSMPPPALRHVREPLDKSSGSVQLLLALPLGELQVMKRHRLGSRDRLGVRKELSRHCEHPLRLRARDTLGPACRLKRLRRRRFGRARCRDCRLRRVERPRAPTTSLCGRGAHDGARLCWCAPTPSLCGRGVGDSAGSVGESAGTDGRRRGCRRTRGLCREGVRCEGGEGWREV